MPNVVTLSVLPLLFSRSSAVCADAAAHHAHSAAASNFLIVDSSLFDRSDAARIGSGVCRRRVTLAAVVIPAKAQSKLNVERCGLGCVLVRRRGAAMRYDLHRGCSPPARVEETANGSRNRCSSCVLHSA